MSRVNSWMRQSAYGVTDCAVTIGGERPIRSVHGLAPKLEHGFRARHVAANQSLDSPRRSSRPASLQPEASPVRRRRRRTERRIMWATCQELSPWETIHAD